MKVEPVAWIGQDAFAALSGGETVCQTMTPRQAMYDDVPLCVMPPAGYALVPVELIDEVCESMELSGMHDDPHYQKLKAIYRESTAAKGE